MVSPKPISLTAGTNPNPSVDPQAFIVVGGFPDLLDPQAAPVIDSTPADAAAVAVDLQALVDALVLAGVLTD